MAAKPRPTTVRRVPEYLGPDKEITPEQLEALDEMGIFLCQEKIDGIWCMLEVGNPAKGRPNRLKSRDARTPDVSGSSAGNFPQMQLPFPEGTILVGELEASSQWSKEQVQKNGVRRLHLFDIVKYGDEDLRTETTQNRFNKVADLYSVFLRQLPEFALVECHYSCFRRHYEAWIANGGEGCVVKPLASSYTTDRLDGKRSDWYRCKKILTGDYVLCGLGKTPGGKSGKPKITGRWGLFKNGVLEEVMQAPANPALLVPANIGMLVCEFRGWARFESGALRHAQLVRVRDDKAPEDCV